MIHSFQRGLARLRAFIGSFIDFRLGPDVFRAELEGIHRGVSEYIKARRSVEEEIGKEISRSFDRQRDVHNAELALRDVLFERSNLVDQDRRDAQKIRDQIDKLLA